MKAVDIYTAVAKEASVKTPVAKAVLEGLKAVLARDLREQGHAKLPSMVTFKTLTKRAKDARVKNVFGRPVQVSAKPASRCVRATPAKQLTDAVIG
jgi:nucleoid DNA-binding protein